MVESRISSLGIESWEGTVTIILLVSKETTRTIFSCDYRVCSVYFSIVALYCNEKGSRFGFVFWTEGSGIQVCRRWC